MITARLSNYRQSPRKVRLVANLVKGMPVPQAMAELTFLAKRAGMPIRKLIASAVSNAKEQNLTADALFVKNLTVDKGIVMYRMMPRARGSAYRIRKRSSHLVVTLDDIKNKPGKKAAKRATVATPAGKAS
jgi:large subunit ribosomal protein L22